MKLIIKKELNKEKKINQKLNLILKDLDKQIKKEKEKNLNLQKIIKKKYLS